MYSWSLLGLDYEERIRVYLFACFVKDSVSEADLVEVLYLLSFLLYRSVSAEFSEPVQLGAVRLPALTYAVRDEI